MCVKTTPLSTKVHMSSSWPVFVTLEELVRLLDVGLAVPCRKLLLPPPSIALEIKQLIHYWGNGPAIMWGTCCHPTLRMSLGLGSPWEWRVDLLWTVCISRHQVIFWLWKHSGKNCHETVHFKHQAGKTGFPLCYLKKKKKACSVCLSFLFYKIDLLEFYILAYVSEIAQ